MQSPSIQDFSATDIETTLILIQNILLKELWFYNYSSLLDYLVPIAKKAIQEFSTIVTLN